MKNKRFSWGLSLLLFLTFVVFTFFVKVCDVAPIGPEDSLVGLSRLNGYFHNLTGVHLILYTITDYASILPVAAGMGFGLVGLIQWIRRKNMLKVDGNLLALGLFYILVFCVYAVFQFVVINYRPVLIDGVLEASYPSSTTVLSLTFLLADIPQAEIYIKKPWLRKTLYAFCPIYAAFLLVLRVFSGVHWLTDIVGGVIVSAACISLYFPLSDAICHWQKQK